MLYYRRIRQYGGGFLQLIIIIILAVIILSLLGISLGSLLNNKTLRENFVLLWHGVVWAWQNYLAPPAIALWRWVRGFVG